MRDLSILIIFLPLLSSLISGFIGKYMKNVLVHIVSVSLIAISTFLSIKIFYGFLFDNFDNLESTIYIWGNIGNLTLEIGLLIDKLTVLMMVVVTFVSLMVHIYTIGYMHEDDGYIRFFCYISFFTFAMLILVASNNFLQLFFGWEAVGLASYLLIGFWYKKESAIFASLKAFLVNRVGDLGFLIGIAAILFYFGTLNYIEVFDQVSGLVNDDFTIFIFSNLSISVITLICICLFIGAMGKSAQIPLHVWLPDSMEGPTPISALIHAATMVTAGIFMTTRMSFLFEYSEVALIFIIFTGSITCFLMGLLGIVQNDIKRIVAYSTLSQLGLMVTALGVSAYSVAIFHLMTHAFFKALLFLGAGSVIVAMHHEQNILNMGNIKKYMPVTYYTMFIGSLALIGFPGFSGFFSKDLIIEAVYHSHLFGAKFAYYFIFFSVFITAFYTFRLFFLVFHTNERMTEKIKLHLEESSSVIYIPLIFLAILSIFSGWFFIDDILVKDYFKDTIFVLKKHDVIFDLKKDFHGSHNMFLHGFFSMPCLMAYLGILFSWIFYCKKPEYSIYLKEKFNIIYYILINKYGFDILIQTIIVPAVLKIGLFFWNVFDKYIIDSFFVNGTAKIINWSAKRLRVLQTGYLYHYVFIMVTGILLLLFWLTFVLK
ncbi:MAG: NADH-quinone oxidoreductase subunit L [Candidatus Azosocius agrarius]|nr:MAG: NADH-quinone oxidoreductase subunit L [Gammaproteobacteria bacterium]